MTELCRLAEKYGTDKCLKLNHSYTPYYFKLFSPIRNDVKTLVELGIGRNKHSRGVASGASLRMWRDFFPNAQIYGIDIVPKTIFAEERIRTFCCDGTDAEGMRKILDGIGDIDIFIDDGSHLWEHQNKTAEIVLPIKGIYIIEDAMHPEKINIREYETVEFEGRDPIRRPDDRLIIIR